MTAASVCTYPGLNITTLIPRGLTSLAGIDSAQCAPTRQAEPLAMFKAALLVLY
jgi:hypothetical protein